MATNKTFAERLTALRENTGKKRQEVADDLKISRASLEYYEKGKRKPDIEVLVRLADYYGVSTDYLLGLSDVSTTDKDLQFVCDYTGLNAHIIKLFFHNNNYRDTNFSIFFNEVCNYDEGAEYLRLLISNIYNFKLAYKAKLEMLLKYTNEENDTKRSELWNECQNCEDVKELLQFRTEKAFRWILELFVKEESTKELEYHSLDKANKGGENNVNNP